MFHKRKMTICNVAIHLGTTLIYLGISMQQSKTDISKNITRNLTNKNKEGDQL